MRVCVRVRDRVRVGVIVCVCACVAHVHACVCVSLVKLRCYNTVAFDIDRSVIAELQIFHECHVSSHEEDEEDDES